MSRKYFIRTFGCQMNEHDSERIAGLLEADGLDRAATARDADVIVLNTCCIRENADNKLHGALGHLKAVKAARPEVEIAVGGCLAQRDGDLIRLDAPHVDVVFGTHNLHRVVELLGGARASGPVTELWGPPRADDDGGFPSALPVRREVDHAAWVTIQIGCDNTCAFCVVPSVRGPEMSRPFGQIVDEVRRLASEDVVEVTLLGQNVNSYGRDITTRLRRRPAGSADVEQAGETWAGEPGRRARPLFADLLRAVGGVPGLRRVRFTSPHPKDLRPETITAMAETPTVCPHLHLPLQAGSDRTLRSMHRGYTAGRYLERLAAARDAVADLAVTTDLIVGFPGETEADFEQTLEVVAEAGYDSAYTFIFSPRPGTEAERRRDEFVPSDVSADRFERLLAVVDRAGLARHRARVGRREEVLSEGPAKRDPNLTTGRTGQNKLVHFRADPALAPGTFAEVVVVGAGKHHLRGELVDVTAHPRHRTRIPVVSV